MNPWAEIGSWLFESLELHWIFMSFKCSCCLQTLGRYLQLVRKRGIMWLQTLALGMFGYESDWEYFPELKPLRDLGWSKFCCQVAASTFILKFPHETCALNLMVVSWQKHYCSTINKCGGLTSRSAPSMVGLNGEWNGELTIWQPNIAMDFHHVQFISESVANEPCSIAMFV